MITLAANMDGLSRSYETKVEDRVATHQTLTVFEAMIKDKNDHERGLEFSLHELRFKLYEKSRPILQSISGKIMQGRLFGIMGPSGAGKCRLTVFDNAANWS